MLPVEVTGSVVLTVVPLSVIEELTIEFAPLATGTTLVVNEVDVVFPELDGEVHEGTPADVSCRKCVEPVLPVSTTHADPFQ